MQETKILVLVIFVATLLVTMNPGKKTQAQNPSQVLGVQDQVSDLDFPISQTKRSAMPRPKGIVPLPVVSASAVLVRDYDSGLVLFQKNPNKQVPIASITKLATALVVYKESKFGDIVEIISADSKTAPTKAGFVHGELVRIEDLLKAMLISSANDAALALARQIGPGIPAFVAKMNNQAKALNMLNTSFANPVGFDHPNHYSNASDLAKLVEEFMKYPELLRIVNMKTDTISSVDGTKKHTLLTTNKLLGGDVVGIKTGYTQEAKGNLVVLVDPDVQVVTDRYYSILLGSLSREKETHQIMDWVKQEFEWK